MDASDSFKQASSLIERELVRMTGNSITILGFQVESSPFELFPGTHPKLLYDFAKDGAYTADVDWIKHVLSEQKIQGELLFMAEGLARHHKIKVHPWARVILGADSQWIEPLWKLGHGLYFMPTDLSWFFEIVYDEPTYRAYLLQPDATPRL